VDLLAVAALIGAAIRAGVGHVVMVSSLGAELGGVGREGGEEEAIAGLPARTTGSAPKHVQLMAEHQQLDVAIAVPAGEQGVEKQAEDGVDDR